MSLRISLRDGEKMIINGAVLQARGRTEFVVENQVAILRGREVMSPVDATTPARRLYLACMMAYVDEGARAEHQDRIVALLGDLLGAFETIEARTACLDFAQFVARGDYYRGLGVCRTMMAHEAAVFARLTGEAA